MVVRVSALGLLMACLVSSVGAFQCAGLIRISRLHAPARGFADLDRLGSRARGQRRPGSRLGGGTSRLVSQLDPARCVADVAAGYPAIFHTLSSPMYLAVDAGALEDVQEYVMAHPLQDAAAIALMVFTLVNPPTLDPFRAALQ